MATEIRSEFGRAGQRPAKAWLLPVVDVVTVLAAYGVMTVSALAAAGFSAKALLSRHAPPDK